MNDIAGVDVRSLLELQCLRENEILEELEKRSKDMSVDLIPTQPVLNIDRGLELPEAPLFKRNPALTAELKAMFPVISAKARLVPLLLPLYYVGGDPVGFSVVKKRNSEGDLVLFKERFLARDYGDWSEALCAAYLHRYGYEQRKYKSSFIEPSEALELLQLYPLKEVVLC